MTLLVNLKEMPIALQEEIISWVSRFLDIRDLFDLIMRPAWLSNFASRTAWRIHNGSAIGWGWRLKSRNSSSSIVERSIIIPGIFSGKSPGLSVFILRSISMHWVSDMKSELRCCMSGAINWNDVWTRSVTCCKRGKCYKIVARFSRHSSNT